MEKKYLYTLKDVILGLRPLYKAYYAELNRLKEFCKSSDKVEDFYFYVHQNVNNLPKLYCEIMEKESFLMDTIEKAKCFFVGSDLSQNTLSYENGKLEGIRKKSPITILPGRELTFTEEAEHILASEFISSFKEINQTGINSLCDSGTLYLRTNNISVTPNKDNPLPELFYSPLRDTLTFTETDSKFKVSEFGIKRVLGMYYFVDSFQEYHLTSMNSEAMKNKKLLVEPFLSCHNLELKISEDKDSIRLTKIQKK